MARDGSGNHSLPEAAFVSGTTIESAKVNSNFSDISSALTGSIAKDGQTVPTANLPMGGFKHTNVAVATSRTDYARASQIADNSMGYAASSGTDTITATPAPGISAYAIGQRFTLKKDANANTGAVTLNINSIGAGNVTWPDGTALAAGDLPANCAFEVVVQATTPVFHLMTGAKPPLPKAGGTVTGTVTMSGAAINEAKGTDIASATTTDIGAATGNSVDVTGTTTITGLGTVQAGTRRMVRFTGSLTLTHNATSLILPGRQNITTQAGDTAEFLSLGSGNWVCTYFQPAGGFGVVVGRSFNTYTANSDLSTTIPADDTIPQSSEGTQIFSVSYTPKTTTNRLRARFMGSFSTAGSADQVCAALFLNSNTDATRAAWSTTSGGGNLLTPVVLEHEWVPGSTSAQTIAIRAGGNGVTIRANGTSSARYGGGASAVTLIIEELLP